MSARDLVFAILGGVLAWAGPAALAPAGAADLPGGAAGPSLCAPGYVSPIAGLPLPEARSEVEFRYARAAATLDARPVVYSRSPGFTWAQAASHACATSIGYLKAGVLDAEYVSRCDCFHARMVGYVR